MSVRAEITEIIAGRRELLASAAARNSVLLVEDVPPERSCATFLAKLGLQVETTSQIDDLAEHAKRKFFDVFVVNMNKLTRESFVRLKQSRETDHALPFIALLNHPTTIEINLRAKNAGNMELLPAPLALQELAKAVRRGLSIRRILLLESDARSHQRRLHPALPFSPIVSARSRGIWAYDLGLPEHGRAEFCAKDSLLLRDQVSQVLDVVPQSTRLIVPIALQDLAEPSPLSDSIDPLRAHADRVIYSIQATPAMLSIRELDRTVRVLSMQAYTFILDGFMQAECSIEQVQRLNPAFARVHIQGHHRDEKWLREFDVVRRFCEQGQIGLIAGSIDSKSDLIAAQDAGFQLLQGTRISAEIPGQFLAV